MSDFKKSTIIEGIASPQTRDIQNEILDLGGADIKDLEEGRGFVNSDHRPEFEHLVGRVLSAKKIHKAEDAETDMQKRYWDSHKKPFLWTKLELWDGAGHKEADSIAAIYNFYKSKGEDAPIKLSVEGKVIERGAKGVLKRTTIKGVALTVHPANRMTKTQVMDIVKSAGGPEALVKGEEDSIPFFIETPETPAEKLLRLAKIARDLLKSATNQNKT